MKKYNILFVVIATLLTTFSCSDDLDDGDYRHSYYREKQSNSNQNNQSNSNQNNQSDISQYIASGEHNGHEYVDLGLPSGTLWATCNVGADKIEGSGNYYAWGETAIKTIYSSATQLYTKNADLELANDAAHVNWGGDWRMPTYAEINELLNHCLWTWTSVNGVSGYKVSNTVSGKNIFLPAAGYRSDSKLMDDNFEGYYWSSLLGDQGASYCLYILSSGAKGLDYRRPFASNFFIYFHRYYGRTVRPVLSGSAKN